MSKLNVALLVCALVFAVGGQQVSAGTVVSYQFTGTGNWSLDAIGSNSSPVGIVSAEVPLGSTVEKAYLYSSKTPADSGTIPIVVFEGVTYSGVAWTPLGYAGSLQAFRTDVTAQIQGLIGSGSASRFDFTIQSETVNTQIDGEVLAIVYSNPAEVERTIAFLDGYSNMAGDVHYFNFNPPLSDPTAAGFEALLSLGIGYGYQSQYNGQRSTVDINGVRMTSSAGGEDDGISANGGLITVGGLDDSPALPPDPYAQPTTLRYDDELYDVSSFLSTGDTNFQVNTANPSLDDNIFFIGLNVTAKGEVTPDPIPPVVPEPLTILALAVGIGGLGRYARRRLT